MSEPALLTMECVIPESHMPGQKLVWVSPTGQKVALTVPETAKPGQTLEFQLPQAIVNGGSSENAAPPIRPPAPEPSSEPASEPAEVSVPAGDGDQATLEVVIPADWLPGAPCV